MKNNKVLNARELHNRGIESKTRTYLANFDFLSQLLNENLFNSYKFSAIGFDFDSDNYITQIQLMDGFDIFEVLKEAYHNEEKYGNHFCILHHDLSGFHYIVF